MKENLTQRQMVSASQRTTQEKTKENIHIEFENALI